MAKFVRSMFREEFDQRRDFVVKRPYVFSGKAYLANHKITPEEKAGYTYRRLRQLYDMRMIEYFLSSPPTSLGVPGVPPVPPIMRPKEPVAEAPKPRERYRPKKVLNPRARPTRLEMSGDGA